MSTLLLRLAAPMQSWGDSSRFAARHTRTEPTKSGVLGLLAAAQGRRRTESVEDLVELRFGVRVDQPGRVMSDFHTAINWRSGKSMPLSDRYYLEDAIFVAAVEGEESVVHGLAEAVRAPRFPLYLGRRSCPLAGEVYLDVHPAGVREALAAPDDGGAAWQASRWYRRTQPSQLSLARFLDAADGEASRGQQRDVPVSFDPRRREYGWRAVTEAPIWIANAEGHDRPDFIATAGGR